MNKIFGKSKRAMVLISLGIMGILFFIGLVNAISETIPISCSGDEEVINTCQTTTESLFFMGRAERPSPFPLTGEVSEVIDKGVKPLYILPILLIILIISILYYLRKKQLFIFVKDNDDVT